MCAITFVTFVNAHSFSGAADTDNEDADVDGEDDPVAHMKTARVLRGRARPRDLANAAKFLNKNHTTGFASLAQASETIRGALHGTDESLGNRLADFVAPAVRPAATLGWFRVRTLSLSHPRSFLVRVTFSHIYIFFPASEKEVYHRWHRSNHRRAWTGANSCAHVPFYRCCGKVRPSFPSVPRQ